MRIQFEDGSAFYVDGDTLPPDLTVEELKTSLTPWALHEARVRLAELLAQRANTRAVSDEDLIAWARQAHPTAATVELLNRQIAEQQNIIDGFSA